MEQFEIPGDHVRHPLQVILARAALMEDEEAAEKIREFLKRSELVQRSGGADVPRRGGAARQDPMRQ